MTEVLDVVAPGAYSWSYFRWDSEQSIPSASADTKPRGRKASVAKQLDLHVEQDVNGSSNQSSSHGDAAMVDDDEDVELSSDDIDRVLFGNQENGEGDQANGDDAESASIVGKKRKRGGSLAKSQVESDEESDEEDVTTASSRRKSTRGGAPVNYANGKSKGSKGNKDEVIVAIAGQKRSSKRARVEEEPQSGRSRSARTPSKSLSNKEKKKVEKLESESDDDGGEGKNGHDREVSENDDDHHHDHDDHDDHGHSHGGRGASSKMTPIHVRRWSHYHIATPEDPANCTRLHRKPSQLIHEELKKKGIAVNDNDSGEGSDDDELQVVVRGGENEARRNSSGGKANNAKKGGNNSYASRGHSHGHGGRQGHHHHHDDEDDHDHGHHHSHHHDGEDGSDDGSDGEYNELDHRWDRTAHGRNEDTKCYRLHRKSSVVMALSQQANAINAAVDDHAKKSSSRK